MKKLVFASVMAMAILSLICTQSLRAQNDQITITDQAEFNAYQNATTQSDPAAKAAAIESFLTTYPQSKVKIAMLDMLVDAYQASNNPDKTVDAAKRLLQLDPNNLKAIVFSVYIKKSQKQYDDAAALAQKGLLIKKPASVKDSDWKDQTSAAYPLFHSALAAQALNKGDYKTAIAEFNIELQLTAPEATASVLPDMLTLAQTYADAKAKDQRDLVKACWFYARVWSFAPANFKPKIEQPLEYWYKKFHGSLEGLDALKQQAAATMFPPGTLQIKPADTPADIAHKAVATTPDLSTLNLSDKEYILANGSKEDVDKVWAVMKGQQTPVPGVVIDATASVIKVAVTDDAKQAKVADFIVNLKEPLADKDIPVAGFEYKIPNPKDPKQGPVTELAGTYDSFTQVAATDANPYASAVIVLTEGIVVAPKKTPAHPPAHKPTAAHHQ